MVEWVYLMNEPAERPVPSVTIHTSPVTCAESFSLIIELNPQWFSRTCRDSLSMWRPVSSESDNELIPSLSASRAVSPCEPLVLSFPQSVTFTQKEDALGIIPFAQNLVVKFTFKICNKVTPRLKISWAIIVKKGPSRLGQKELLQCHGTPVALFTKSCIDWVLRGQVMSRAQSKHSPSS